MRDNAVSMIAFARLRDGWCCRASACVSDTMAVYQVFSHSSDLLDGVSATGAILAAVKRDIRPLHPCSVCNLRAGALQKYVLSAPDGATWLASSIPRTAVLFGASVIGVW